MHGLSILLLKGRERTSAILAAIPFLILAVLAPPARRTIVDGQQVAEMIAFGHVVPKWLFIAVFAPLFGLVWLGIHRLLERLWPEKKDSVQERRYVNPIIKGAWTATEFLTSPTPDPVTSQMSDRDWLEDFSAFRTKMEAWIATATDATLNELLPAAHELANRIDEEAVSRLAEAHERRGIPNLDGLSTLAEEIDNEELREYVRERREEQDSSTFSADRVYERPGGGYVAWKGDDPDAGSPMDYAPPQLRTALDYLQAEEPPPMRFLLGEKFAHAELDAYHTELARWLREASDDTLSGLAPAIRSMANSVDYETVERLTRAHEERNIPTLEELSVLASELENEDLKAYVSEENRGV